MSDWVAAIGLEIHIQLNTDAKLFSNAPTQTGDGPNSAICPWSLGLPGALPTLNRAAVDKALRLALALGAEIDGASTFDRKHYIYPDQPKGFQVTQHARPLARGGAIRFFWEGVERAIRLDRLHIEEDAGKSVHDQTRNQSRLDFNRAGMPLVEVVTAPVLTHAAEAAQCFRALRRLVQALGISEAALEQGDLRCDVNVSINSRESACLGAKVEIKNLNSYRFVADAVDAEIARQIALKGAGDPVRPETRRWDVLRGESVAMRGKEGLADYRFLPEPDLMVLRVSAGDQAAAKAALPELPNHREARYRGALGLGADAAAAFTNDRALGVWFDAALDAMASPAPVLLAQWLRGPLTGALRRAGVGFGALPEGPQQLATLLDGLQKGALTTAQVKRGFAHIAGGASLFSEWLAEASRGVAGGAVPEEIDAWVAETLDSHPEEVNQWAAGKARLATFFVGEIMRKAHGRANPQAVSSAVHLALEARR